MDRDDVTKEFRAIFTSDPTLVFPHNNHYNFRVVLPRTLKLSKKYNWKVGVERVIYPVLDKYYRTYMDLAVYEKDIKAMLGGSTSIDGALLPATYGMDPDEIKISVLDRLTKDSQKEHLFRDSSFFQGDGSLVFQKERDFLKRQNIIDYLSSVHNVSIVDKGDIYILRFDLLKSIEEKKKISIFNDILEKISPHITHKWQSILDNSVISVGIKSVHGITCFTRETPLEFKKSEIWEYTIGETGLKKVQKVLDFIPDIPNVINPKFGYSAPDYQVVRKYREDEDSMTFLDLRRSRQLFDQANRKWWTFTKIMRIDTIFNHHVQSVEKVKRKLLNGVTKVSDVIRINKRIPTYGYDDYWFRHFSMLTFNFFLEILPISSYITFKSFLQKHSIGIWADFFRDYTQNKVFFNYGREKIKIEQMNRYMEEMKRILNPLRTLSDAYIYEIQHSTFNIQDQPKFLYLLTLDKDARKLLFSHDDMFLGVRFSEGFCRVNSLPLGWIDKSCSGNTRGQGRTYCNMYCDMIEGSFYIDQNYSILEVFPVDREIGQDKSVEWSPSFVRYLSLITNELNIMHFLLTDSNGYAMDFHDKVMVFLHFIPEPK